MCIRCIDYFVFKDFCCFFVIEDINGFFVFEFVFVCNDNILSVECVNFFCGFDYIINCF